MRLLTTERRLVADGHDFSLTFCGVTRIYSRPVPVAVLLLLVLGFGHFAPSTRACVCTNDSSPPFALGMTSGPMTPCLVRRGGQTLLRSGPPHRLACRPCPVAVPWLCPAEMRLAT